MEHTLSDIMKRRSIVSLTVTIWVLGLLVIASVGTLRGEVVGPVARPDLWAGWAGACLLGGYIGHESRKAKMLRLHGGGAGLRRAAGGGPEPQTKGRTTTNDEWATTGTQDDVARLPNVPAFIETDPDSFKPVEECSIAELTAAADAKMLISKAAMDEAKGLCEMAAGQRSTG